MTHYLLLFVAAVFVNNVVLSQFLGICPFLGVSKKVDTAIGMGAAVTFVLALSTMCTFLLQKFVLEPFDMVYMQTISFILVIAALVQMVEIILKKVSPCTLPSPRRLPPAHHDELLRPRGRHPRHPEGIHAAGERRLCDLHRYRIHARPRGLRWHPRATLSHRATRLDEGIPIALISAGILAMAFMGFSGMVKM